MVEMLPQSLRKLLEKGDVHPDAHDHAFVLKRATGEIEIRAAHPGALKREIERHGAEFVFDDPIKHHDTLHSVKGRRA